MLNIVSIISTRLDSTSRMLVKFLRKGKSDVRESFEIGPFGFESNPLKDMIALYGQTDENGSDVIIGYVNKNRITDIGESRMFSTDSSGNIVMYLHMKNDGTAEFNGDSDNLVRYSELESAFNELKSDHNELVTKWNAFVAAYVPGSPSTVGLPPTLAGSNVSQSTASVAGAKIDELKTN